MGTFDQFLAAYPVTRREVVTDAWDASRVDGFDELMTALGGSTFDRGLYRLHTPQSAQLALTLIGEAFPELSGGIAPFGFDWLGRQFAMDLRGGRDPLALLVDAGTGEVLEIPASFVDFHDRELVDEPDAALATSFFDEWAGRNASLLPLAPDVCVGYVIPLFLGGRDEIDNLAPIDIWVYWSLTGQLVSQTRGLAPGTQISDIRFE